MHIAIYAPRLSLPRCGIATYTTRLIEGLSEVDNKNSYTIFADGETTGRLGKLGGNFEVVHPGRFTGSRWASVIWEQTFLPRELRRRKVDILHSMNMVSPAALRSRSVITYHDLTVLMFPELHSAVRQKYYAVSVPRSLRKADAVICISRSTRRDLLSAFDVEPSRVHVVHIGVEDSGSHRRGDGEEERVRARYGIEEPFVLYVGTLEPRKNVPRLLEGFVKAGRAWADFPPKLVVAGRKGWQYGEIFAKASELKVEESVVFTGSVDDGDLGPLYRAATAVAYPSLYEGFGLPLLEAMAQGTPVVTSCVSSLPEVAGGAAVLVDPYDTDDIARGLADACLDTALRAKLKQRGTDRAKSFSWQQTARRTLKVYEGCAEGMGRPA